MFHFRFSLKRLLFRLVMLITCCVLLLAFLVYQEVKDKPSLISPPATALLEDRYGNFLSEGSGNSLDNIGYWKLPELLPKRIEAVFLAIEDKRFYQHSGVDMWAVLRALWNNLTNDQRQGASTIAMQVARMQNTFLSPSWEGPGVGREVSNLDLTAKSMISPGATFNKHVSLIGSTSLPPTAKPRFSTPRFKGGVKRTYWKKLCESITALLLIRKFGHRVVLRHYLEIVPQGNRIHGVAYAARRYFRKPLQDVSWAEAAVLAALPKAPGRMNLFRTDGRKRAFTRTTLILKLLHEHGTLTHEDFLAAQQQLSTLTIPTKEIRPSHSYHAILRVEKLLHTSMRNNTPLPPSRGEFIGDLSSRGGVVRPIRTSLDFRIQEKVYEIVNDAITHYRASGAGNIAVMVVQKETGRVRAYLGSADYYDAEYAGAINYARVPRSSGSTLKPFIYALGLERGEFTPASLLSDAPLLVSLPGGYHRIGNYDGQNLGPLLYRKALANSRNVPAIHVLMQVGIENAYELFRQLGLVSGHRAAEYYGVGMAIGTLYVTLEDLVTAYGVLANEGKAFRLCWFETEGTPANEQWMGRDVARQITLFLSDPLSRLPVFSRMGPLEYLFPVALKTGTSQGFRDAWTIAYSSKYLVGVWIGHPDHHRMKHVSGQTAAQVVKQIMLFLHPEERRGIAENIFPPPEGYKLVQLCAQTGRLATDNCPEVIPEYFRPGTEPVTRLTKKEFPSWEGPAGGYASIQEKSVILEERGIRNPLSFTLAPFSYEQLLNASISIQEPRNGSTFVIDPDTPRTLQTLSLRADVRPVVAKIVWHVDGKPFETVSYPYTLRWPLTPGTHTIQARFAHADIMSDVITITVY